MISRGNQRRSANRNSEMGEPGEEIGTWREFKEKLPGIIDQVNASSNHTAAMADLDAKNAEKKKNGTLTVEDLNKMDQLSRQGVKSHDDASKLIKDQIEKLRVLRAIAKHNEEMQEASSSRATGQRKDLWEFTQDDSPMPSPNPNIVRRMGGKGERGDSVPPKFPDRSTPAAKAGSAEPQPGPAANAIRTKQIFAKDDEVAFKPKPAGNTEQTDWILGIVQEVRGEGKSRRYRVLDADVVENHLQKDFRTSASSMILIPKEGTVLPPLEEGRVVLALYPNTTTFYKAEVIGMDGNEKVNLRFEGEESSNTMQAVTRRYVVEYRA
ncbi:hypothetical protein GGR50DRAFT_687804 [Xylaria sp. CBS 124048]|nr:hypothetical protein GGR50DRAFT_687804 [Xylaria sp. CBS 124048]